MMKSKQQTLRILAPLIMAFPNSKATEGTLEVYATALSCLSEAELTASVMKCMRTCKFFPSIAEIMEQAEHITQVASGTSHKSNDEAWTEVLKQINEAFIYRKPVFSTPEIESAALAMGWAGLCQTELEDMGTIRAQFLRMYESTCKRKKEAKIDEQVLDVIGALGIEIKTIGGRDAYKRIV